MSGARLAAVTLLVDDYDRAIRWFVDVAGFSLVEDTPLAEGRRWVVVSPGGEEAGARLLLARADGSAQRQRIGDQTGGRVGFFLETTDFERRYHAMRSRGVCFREAPREEVYGKVAVFEDLYGNRWDLIEPAARRG